MSPDGATAKVVPQAPRQRRTRHRGHPSALAQAVYESLSVAQLPEIVVAPRIDSAIRTEAQAVVRSCRHAPHPNLGHASHRGWDGVTEFQSTVAHCFSLVACQQPAGRIHKQAVLNACRNGGRLPAAALPRTTDQVRHSRLEAADGASAWNQLASGERVLAWRCEHRRLGWQLRRPIAIAEALARLGNADEVAEIEL